MLENSFRLGLQVDDVETARDFYHGLGFEHVGEVLGEGGVPLLVILRQAGIHLIVESLDGVPHQDQGRRAEARQGPRGLGVVLGFGANDLEATYRYCVANGCEITCEPMDEEWGDRVFGFIDPFGFEWEPTHPMADMTVKDATGAVAENWATLRC